MNVDDAPDADRRRILEGLTAFMECLRGGHDPIKDANGEVLGVSFLVSGAIGRGLARACRRCRLVYWALDGVDFCGKCYGGGRHFPFEDPCTECGGTGMKPKEAPKS